MPRPNASTSSVVITSVRMLRTTVAFLRLSEGGPKPGANARTLRKNVANSAAFLGCIGAVIAGPTTLGVPGNTWSSGPHFACDGDPDPATSADFVVKRVLTSNGTLIACDYSAIGTNTGGWANVPDIDSSGREVKTSATNSQTSASRTTATTTRTPPRASPTHTRRLWPRFRRPQARRLGPLRHACDCDHPLRCRSVLRDRPGAGSAARAGVRRDRRLQWHDDLPVLGRECQPGPARDARFLIPGLGGRGPENVLYHGSVPRLCRLALRQGLLDAASQPASCSGRRVQQ
jgi:hypothetical protein